MTYYNYEIPQLNKRLSKIEEKKSKLVFKKC